MNLATTKNAADSTTTAAPADSQSAEEKNVADTGDVTSADVAAALGLTPEGQETDGADKGTDDDAETETETEDGTEGAAEETADEDATDEGTDDGADTDESAETEAEGEAEVEAGASDTNEETAQEGAEETPAPKDGKKHEQFQQRINELTSAKKNAEQQVSDLREKLSVVQARDEGRLDAGTLEAVDSDADLEKLRARYVNLHEWTLENPDGGKLPDGKGGESEFSREEVAHIKAQTFGLLNRDVPKRAEYLKARHAHEAVAAQSYPWLKEKTKGDGKAVQEAIEALPFLRKIPNYRLVAANAYVGEKLRRAGITVDDALIARLAKEQKAKGPATDGQQTRRAPAPTLRAPAAPGRSGVTPPRRTPAAAEIRAQERRLNESSGSVDDLTASIAAKLKPTGRR